MEIYSDIIIFLMVSIFVVLACRRLKTSPVLGYLLFGAIIGPHATNIIDGVEASKHVAEFGIVFLLFTIGLELSWERLLELRRQVFGLGTLQFTLTSIAFSTLIYFVFSLSLEMSILLGSGLALSSTAVVLQVLADRNELSTRTGRATFSILLFQDIAVVFILVWISTISTSSEPLLHSVGYALLRGSVVLVTIALGGRFVLRPLYRLVAQARNYELFMATTLLIVISVSVLTGFAGLSMELGAFLGGLMLAETEYSHQIEADIKPFRALLLGLFFITIGMAIDPKVISQKWLLILISTIGLITIKAFIIFIIGFFFRMQLKTCIKTGLMLAAGGEFTFVIMSQAIEQNLLDTAFSQIVNVTVIISMALTPFLAMLGKWIGHLMPSPIGYALRRAEVESKDTQNHVIIAGYGRVGQFVGKILSKHMISFSAIDMDMKRVSIGRNDEGVSTFFGDARRVEIYRALGAEKARAIALTLSSFNTIVRSVMILKRFFPNTPIIARAHDQQQAQKLRKLGATPIMPEAYAPSFQLSAAILGMMNFSHDQIEQTIHDFRKNHFTAEDFDENQSWNYASGRSFSNRKDLDANPAPALSEEKET